MTVRLRRWPLKLAYVVVAYLALGFAVSRLLAAGHVPDPVIAIVHGVVPIAAVLVGARIFRGRDEPDWPARPWWQMTARATLSRRLGVIAIVGASLYAVRVVVDGVTRKNDVVSDVIDLVLAVAIAYLYVNSGVRLRKREAVVVPVVASPVESEPETPSEVGIVVPGATSRLRVVEVTKGIVGISPEGGLLYADPVEQRVDVTVNGVLVGHLSKPSSGVVAGITALGAPARVRVLRTSDRLWAEVPVHLP